MGSAHGHRSIETDRPRLAPFDASGHDDAAVVALVLLGPAAELARGAPLSTASTVFGSTPLTATWTCGQAVSEWAAQTA